MTILSNPYAAALGTLQAQQQAMQQQLMAAQQLSPVYQQGGGYQQAVPQGSWNMLPLSKLYRHGEVWMYTDPSGVNGEFNPEALYVANGMLYFFPAKKKEIPNPVFTLEEIEEGMSYVER